MATSKGTYKSLSLELEEILTQLQSADLDIDKAIKSYERGMTVAKQLEEYLKAAENKISKIKANWQTNTKP